MQFVMYRSVSGETQMVKRQFGAIADRIGLLATCYSFAKDNNDSEAMAIHRAAIERLAKILLRLEREVA